MAYALAAAVLVSSGWFGGWYWALIAAAVVAVQWPRVAYTLAVPLVWLAVFAVTGDRRFFFPFAMYEAVVFGLGWRGGFAAGSALLVGLFTLIRIEQAASFRVIAVELVVAVAAMFAGYFVNRKYGPLAAAVAGSAMALAGLLL